MFIDVAIPSGNEEKFIEIAKKLDTKALIFLYEKDLKSNIEKVKSLNSKDFKVYSGLIVKDNVAKKKYDYVFSRGARNHFENKNVDVIFDVEKASRKDNYHYRNSGLNHVLCNLAKEKKIMMGFNFNNVLKSNDKGFILGRMMQNVMLCKKYKSSMLIASFATKPLELKFSKDLMSFGVSIGMTLNDAKNAVMNP